MAVWGIDLGVRSIHLAKLEGGELNVRSIRSETKARWQEIFHLQLELNGFLPRDTIFIEEPPMVRSQKVHGQMHQVVGLAISQALPAHSFLVNVKTWKKDLIGNGNAPKTAVTQWLNDHYPSYSAICGEDQDLTDATCIALYGRQVLERL